MGFPPSLKELQVKIDPQMREAFARDFSRRGKKLLIAYLLLLLGWHYLYLGKLGHQVALLIILGGFFLWRPVDLFRLPGMVARINKGIAWKLATQYGAAQETMGRLPRFLT
jgi:hypothetical protein